MPAPSAVFVDAGGVLLLPDLAGLAHRFGITASRDELIAAFYRSFEKRDPELDELEWLWSAFMSHFQLDNATIEANIEALRRDAVDPWLTVITAAPGAAEFIAGLAEREILTIVVANSSGQVQSMLETAGVCQVGPGPLPSVLDVIDSSIVGVAKPDPGIFEIARRRLDPGVTPDQLVHIGDALWSDVRGAEAAGVRPLHFDPAGVCPAPYGHEHAQSLSALADLVAV